MFASLIVLSLLSPSGDLTPAGAPAEGPPAYPKLRITVKNPPVQSEPLPHPPRPWPSQPEGCAPCIGMCACTADLCACTDVEPACDLAEAPGGIVACADDLAAVARAAHESRPRAKCEQTSETSVSCWDEDGGGWDCVPDGSGAWGCSDFDMDFWWSTDDPTSEGATACPRDRLVAVRSDSDITVACLDDPRALEDLARRLEDDPTDLAVCTADGCVDVAGHPACPLEVCDGDLSCCILEVLNDLCGGCLYG